MCKIPKILVAEDDELYMKFLTKQLHSENYEVRVARNGLEALALAKRFHPDLVISDWMMPEMTGEEFCKAVKQSPDLKLIYFIILTAKGHIEDLVMGLEGGADDFLTKPCKPKELMARIKTGLRIVALQQENARLERVEAINQTAITANHEINNPLQTIFTSAELILSQNPNCDSQTKEMLLKIIENTRRIRKVTKKLENIIEAVTEEYVKGGPQMIDLGRSIVKDSE